MRCRAPRRRQEPQHHCPCATSNFNIEVRLTLDHVCAEDWLLVRAYPEAGPHQRTDQRRVMNMPATMSAPSMTAPKTIKATMATRSETAPNAAAPRMPATEAPAVVNAIALTLLW